MREKMMCPRRVLRSGRYAADDIGSGLVGEVEVETVDAAVKDEGEGADEDESDSDNEYERLCLSRLLESLLTQFNLALTSASQGCWTLLTQRMEEAGHNFTETLRVWERQVQTGVPHFGTRPPPCRSLPARLGCLTVVVHGRARFYRVQDVVGTVRRFAASVETGEYLHIPYVKAAFARP